ncbi:MAG: cupin domain-containing protein [Patescibacteria group bacterium]|nr:cupin domain-containing protein [Patescibacteria group bacterium]MDD5121284.1 cupin domain-containing protein [Patescibacteria group bacterium]MDD5221824.1 cupin domain-containing protein [Patescibacteria group bacterium]MDD5395797.1 cupin domain-containing protein [Patescibacteria group bacterium]
MQESSAPFGKVQNLESNDKFGSSVLIVEVGQEITKHYHKKTKEIEVILEGEIICDGEIQRPGEVNIWEPMQMHGYKNISNAPVKILCLAVPPYDPNDSFEVGPTA